MSLNNASTALAAPQPSSALAAPQPSQLVRKIVHVIPPKDAALIKEVKKEIAANEGKAIVGFPQAAPVAKSLPRNFGDMTVDGVLVIGQESILSKVTLPEEFASLVRRIPLQATNYEYVNTRIAGSHEGAQFLYPCSVFMNLLAIANRYESSFEGYVAKSSVTWWAATTFCAIYHANNAQAHVLVGRALSIAFGSQPKSTTTILAPGVVAPSGMNALAGVFAADQKKSVAQYYRVQSVEALYEFFRGGAGNAFNLVAAGAGNVDASGKPLVVSKPNWMDVNFKPVRRALAAPTTPR